MGRVKPKVIGVVGYHNSGKTTLVEYIVKALTEEGLKVGYIKHDPKGHGITDREGSDTERLSKVARKVALLSPDKITFWESGSFSPLELVERLFYDCDLVILEGFKSLRSVPKIALGEVPSEGVVLRLEERPKDYERVLDFLRKFTRE